MPTTRPAVADLHNAVTTARGERHAIIPYPLRGRDENRHDDRAALMIYLSVEPRIRTVVCALGDGVAAAPHTGAAVHSRRCGAVCALDGDAVAVAIHTGVDVRARGAAVLSPYRSGRARLMMELLCTLNADNEQVFLWTGI